MAPQSPDLNPIEHIWDVVERELRDLDVHPTNLHQLQDAILSIWANISKECFQHLVESMLHRIKAVLKAKFWEVQRHNVINVTRPSHTAVARLVDQVFLLHPNICNYFLK